MAISETQEFLGRVYRRYPNAKRRSDRKYFRRSVTGGTRLLHREVYEYYNGKIPSGFHIHHIDDDPSNNNIDNLQALPADEHFEHHAEDWTEERRQNQRQWLASVSHLSKAWHSSPEGIAKHREIGAMAYNNFVPEPKPCKSCGEVFSPKAIGNRDEYCSNKCKSAFRRASGVDNIEKVCVTCGSTFSANKYARNKNCGRTCAAKARSKR